VLPKKKRGIQEMNAGTIVNQPHPNQRHDFIEGTQDSTKTDGRGNLKLMEELTLLSELDRTKNLN
jgi:hypothetical protein